MRDLVGKHVVVTGALSHFSRAEAKAALKRAGALVGGSVSSRTDILFAGERAGGKLHQAQMRGVPVLDEDQLLQLLDGAALAPMIAAATVQEEPEADPAALGDLATALTKEPSREIWSEICALIDSYPHDVAEVAVDMVLEATTRWPKGLRVCRQERWSDGMDQRRAPDSWIESAVRGEDHPKLRLIHVLDLRGQKLTGKVAAGMLRCTNLGFVEQLDLTHNKKLSATFYKQLNDSALARPVTHLSLEDCLLKSGHTNAFGTGDGFRNVRSLCMHGCQLDDPQLAAVFFSHDKWASLETLDLGYLNNLHGGGAPALRGLADNDAITGLRSLRLDGLGARPADLELLAHPRFAGLEYLSLYHNRGIGQEHIVPLAGALPRLRKLQLPTASKSMRRAVAAAFGERVNLGS